MEELREPKEGDKMKGYINLTNNKRYLLGKNQYFMQSMSGKTGYFLEDDKDGFVKTIHSFIIWGKIFIY